MTYKVIMCGSRWWDNAAPIEREILRLARVHYDLVIVHGGAPGADTIAGDIAVELDIPVEMHVADWDRDGRAAGPMRNERMLAAGAREVVAFKDAFDFSLSKGGTEHMVKIAKRAGIPTLVLP